ncbi:MAG: hypothetical protein ACYS0F_19565, partial [Planctomycetota bacterium]
MRALLLILLLSAAAPADVTRPAYLGFTEVREGRFDGVWRVPRRGDRVLALRARLPGAFREVAPPTVDIESDVQTTRWTVEAKPWELPGARVAVEGPGTARVDVMVRFEFQDGSVVARILPPGTTECRFPGRSSARSPARELQSSTWSGLSRLGGAHLVFLLGLAMYGRVAPMLALFLLGQLVGMAAGPPIPVPLVYALLAIAGAVFAAAAFRSDRPRAGAIALLAGVAHGSLLASDWLAGIGTAVGMDAGGLVVALVVARVPWKGVAGYSVGVAAVMLALIAATSPEAARSEEPQQSALVAPTAKPPPPSAPVAASSEAPLQLFVEVTPFETRVEWIAKVSALGLDNGVEIRVDEQQALKRRVRKRFDERLTVTIDEKRATAADVRVDFVTREAGGVLERVEPVVERGDSALVGVAHSFATNGPPEQVVVHWSGADNVPAVIVDPQNTRTTILDASSPELTWNDKLAMPPIRAVAVRARAVDFSLLSLALVAVGIVIAVRGGGFVVARLLLAGAFLTAPYARVPIPLPGTSTPDAQQATEVVEALLTNIYRSLEQQDESLAYDRLGLSVAKAALGPLYLDQRRILELGRRGGARARVDSVEVVHLDGIEPLDGVGFRATVAWNAGGFVVHFGHRHFRENNYEAE